jgi:hypothetical protein
MTTEHNAQAILVNWFRRKYRGYLIFAVPNGGARDATTAKRLKTEGTTAGIPDLVIVAKDKIFFVEMKSAKGVLSDKQKAIHEIIRGLGFTVYVAYSWQEAQEKIEKELE